MGDMGDIATAFRRHKAFVSDKRDADAQRHFDAAAVAAQGVGMTLVQEPANTYRLTLPGRAVFMVDPGLRRVNQVQGKKIKLPYYFRTNSGRGWLVDVVDGVAKASSDVR